MKRIFLTIVYAIAVLTAHAALRSQDEAAAIATAFFAEYVPAAAPLRSSSFSSSSSSTFSSSFSSSFYIFTPSSQEGFVVVSADDRARDILCYSTSGTFSQEAMNPSMRWWLNRLAEEIAALPQGETASAEDGDTPVYTPVEPMLKSAWDQLAPFNDECPLSKYYPTEHCMTGCVATAAAQIMRYWEWPLQATGSYSYSYYEYKDDESFQSKLCQESMNFDTITFDWAHMRRTYGRFYTEQEGQAVARLMHACGVACGMEYGSETAGGSGAWTDEMGYALQTYFDYQPVTFLFTKSKLDYQRTTKGEAVADINACWGLSAQAMLDTIICELQAGRPVLMGGEDSNSGGHEFVCDGCDASGRLHIDWGWSGECNCYTTITAMRPSGESYRFKSNLDALIGIVPNRSGIALESLDASSSSSSSKLFLNGRIVILRDGRLYDLLGRPVGD